MFVKKWNLKRKNESLIKRDSFFLLRFHFLAISTPACRLKYPRSCFSSHFCFLVFVVLVILMWPLLLLVVVIILYLLFLMYSSSTCIDAPSQFSILAGPLPPSFLDAYNLSLSSLGNKALCIDFLVLWFIVWVPFLLEWSRVSYMEEWSRVSYMEE